MKENTVSPRQKVMIDCGLVFPWSLLLSIIALKQSPYKNLLSCSKKYVSGNEFVNNLNPGGNCHEKE